MDGAAIPRKREGLCVSVRIDKSNTHVIGGQHDGEWDVLVCVCVPTVQLLECHWLPYTMSLQVPFHRCQVSHKSNQTTGWRFAVVILVVSFPDGKRPHHSCGYDASSNRCKYLILSFL